MPSRSSTARSGWDSRRRVLGELLAGYRVGRRLEENRRWLQRLRSHPVLEDLPVDDSVAEIYGEIFRDLRQSGSPIPTNDLWVAATAARHGATVLTADRHFLSVHRVGTRLLETRS